MAAIGLSLLIWLRKRDGDARQDRTRTSRQSTNTTLAQTSDRDTDKFSLIDNSLAHTIIIIIVVISP